MNSKGLFVLSIDGVPFSLLQEAFARGKMPCFAQLSRQGGFVQMNSVIPTISSVAWATFMTGVNPGAHNIYGFVDRDQEMRFTIPTSRDVKAGTLWERLNEQGKRTIVLNVPVTYPPKPVNGILVAGFLSPSLDRACYPPAISHKLAAMGYIVDPDAWKAKDDRDGFLEDCFKALRARREVALELMRGEDWDFFMLHIMETDRVNHFYWDAYLSRGAREQGSKGAGEPFGYAQDRLGGGARYHQRFWEFYREVDQVIGEVHQALPEGTEFVILSDHGFCGIKKEVDLNAYLRELGFLDFVDTQRERKVEARKGRKVETRKGRKVEARKGRKVETRNERKEPADIHPASRAYSLIPGRIFVNLKGRELTGGVEPEDYEGVREEVAAALLQLTDPETGDRVIQRVYRREELYHGPYLGRAADLIAHPHQGYDLKAKMAGSRLFNRSHRLGMHTYDDALLFVKGHELATEGAISILDVTPTLFELMGLPVPDGLEGRSLLGRGK